MASGARRTISGSFNGTGADLSILTVGFRPTNVKLVNRTGLAKAEWNNSMPDDSMMKQVTDGTMTFPTSNGVTPLANGFALGADADMNVAAELVYWEATD